MRKLPDITGRTFTVGDIHGEYDKLMEALASVGFDFSTDRLIAVGDLIDRGPDSWKCINLIYEPWFHSVLGNHEDLMVGAVTRGSEEHYRCWMQNGGLWALDHLDEDAFNNIVWDVPDRMPIAIEANGCGFIHACPPAIWSRLESVTPMERNYYLWNRGLVGEYLQVKGVDFVYVGHTPVPEVSCYGNVVYIDTGAVFNDTPLVVLEVLKVET
jgi:serine/threonine protein phosphatase 1